MRGVFSYHRSVHPGRVSAPCYEHTADASFSQPVMQVAWRLGRYMATHSEDVNQDDIVVVPARSQQLMGT
jgi:hypothetical protein